MAISSRDVRRIHRFLEPAYELTAEEGSKDGSDYRTLPRPILQGIQALIPADLVESFQLSRGQFRGVPVTTSGDREGPLIVGAFAGRGGTNPINAFAWSPADGPVRLSRLLSRRQLHRLPMYRYHLHPSGIRDQLRIWLGASSDAAACVSLDRSDGDFDDRDVAVLAVLQQHLAAMRESLMLGKATHPDPPFDGLTVREAQVLSWAARGRLNHEIAELLYISPATVRKHLEHAYAKVGVRNRTEAVAALRVEPASSVRHDAAAT
jgi:DNA-binding CsgD family transcriptional regulator